MKAKDISIPMEKQYNPIPSRERIVVTKVNKFFKEKSFKKDNEPIDNWAKIYPKISDEKIRKRLEHSTNCVFVIHDSDKGLINTEFLKNIFASNTNRKYAIVRKKYYNDEYGKIFNHTFLVEKKDNDDKIKIYDSWYLTNKRACFDKCFDANIEDNCEFSMTTAQHFKKDNEPIDNWAKGYPGISDEKIREWLGHSTDCVFVIHDSNEGLIDTKFLKNIFASNTKRKYAIVRKKYYNYEENRKVNHTFLVEKKDDDGIKIYDSWYLTNKRAYFDKCFNANIEDNCEFSMTTAQQDKKQGVCALFALGTYLSLRSGQIKNLSKILKHFNHKINIIETNEIKKRAKWQQNPRFGLGLRY